MFRNALSKTSASAFRPVGGQGSSPVATGCAFGKQVQVLCVGSRPACCFSSVHQGARAFSRMAGNDFPDRKGDGSFDAIRVMQQGTLILRSPDGHELPIIPAPRTLLQPAQPPQQPARPVPEGSGQQLVKLPKQHELSQKVITDPQRAKAAMKAFDLRYDMQAHTPPDFWPLLDQIPFKKGWMYSPTSLVNQITEAQGRKGEWDGPIVVLVNVPAGTRLVQIVTDALPLTPIGRPGKRFDSQAYAMTTALGDGDAAPLGRYFLLCAPISPKQAADYAAILNVWKETCSHLAVVELTADVLMKFGRIGKQVDMLFNPQLGKFERVERRGGALQGCPVLDEDIRTKMRPLNVIRIYRDDDVATLAAIVHSKHPGGYQVQRMLESADSHGFESALPAGLEADVQQLTLALS